MEKLLLFFSSSAIAVVSDILWTSYGYVFAGDDLSCLTIIGYLMQTTSFVLVNHSLYERYCY